jgi:isochorismate synthase
MEQKSLLEIVENHRQQGLPFVLYSLPGSNRVVALLQQDSQLRTTDTFTTKSVIFAPFDFQDIAYCIPEAESKVFEVLLEVDRPDIITVACDEEPAERDRYVQLVRDAIHNILSKNAAKIVISRKKDLQLTKFSFTNLFIRLFNLYPGAFRYIWYHPETGLWCGATPELLVRTEHTSFSSMALAGTQIFNEKTPVYWNDKEIEEHQYVTDAITTSLQKVTDVLKVSKTYTHHAGTLAHLRTDITGILRSGKATLKTISGALHPTPAVCGTPKKAAKNFILEKEGYNREFYTGFIGPICGNDACSSLYVNLRCMKIEGNTATLYVGGGITLASKAPEEWEETQNKLQTMLQVIEPML